ncbi:polysaccharide biosynthesis/export family protein [Pontibacter ramchanderi]|uniref:Polysaccharide export outer membrane protein n=1 Tax=Pontibacter ramchanderi TaxID=1179743 RepID=A0A2N3V1L8_9BACT|nr:polysaccharide biosynthesis/export family protein [Pontibacter ramchanderi]PKV75517.1 polysaccharide export outer membrane protein [Pontibacter ramchanderi]
MKAITLYVIFLLSIASCSPRNLTYLSDLHQEITLSEAIVNDVDPKIQPNDLLNITITSLSAESNILFNRGVIQTGSSGSSESSLKTTGYLVDKSGDITLPVLGKVKLAGLTKDQAAEKLVFELGKYARDPIININFLNFKVTVIGEVNNPSTFTVPSERINVFEALGLAGDMTAYGKRDNVLLIREQDGERTTTRINLNNKDVLQSPYFYLQQNDIIYVEPDRVRAVQVSSGRSNMQYGLSIGLALVSVVTLLVTQVF